MFNKLVYCLIIGNVMLIISAIGKNMTSTIFIWCPLYTLFVFIVYFSMKK